MSLFTKTLFIEIVLWKKWKIVNCFVEEMENCEQFFKASSLYNTVGGGHGIINNLIMILKTESIDIIFNSLKNKTKKQGKPITSNEDITEYVAGLGGSVGCPV